MGRISGPLMDRFDLRIEVEPVAFADLERSRPGESSATVAQRVAQARAIQAERYAACDGAIVNADAEGRVLQDVAQLQDDSRALMMQASEHFGLSARGYHRVLRVARTIADLDGAPEIARDHVAEALSYRLPR